MRYYMRKARDSHVHELPLRLCSSLHLLATQHMFPFDLSACCMYQFSSQVLSCAREARSSESSRAIATYVAIQRQRELVAIVLYHLCLEPCAPRNRLLLTLSLVSTTN